MSSPHAVDIPITDLDEEDDDLASTSEELDPNVLRDDFDIDDEVVFGQRTFVSRVKDAFSKLTQSGYNRVDDPSAMNGIELGHRFGDADSFDLSDDEFMAIRQKETVLSKMKQRVKRYSMRLIILGLVCTVIVLASLLAKKGRSSTSKHGKTLLSNGTDLFFPTTIFISLDGFHPHYISKELTPTLDEFLLKEYGAPYMIPSFPSSTFPNHWTLATGLYPESHGIVGNKFYDPVLKKQFINVIPENSLDPVWWGGEPIWSTAELQGVRTAIHMFPGSEVKFSSGNPTEMDPFNGTETLEIKTERLLGWLDRSIDERPELMVSYVPTIDTLGHHFGIHGQEIQQGLKYVDSYIANITQGIKERNLTDVVNLVVVSDHGMSPTSNDRLVYLDDIINTTKIQHIDGWPLFGLRPFDEYSVEEVYAELQSTFVKGKGYNFYLREDLPQEWHFGHEKSKVLFYDRIAPIWIVPEIGYIITTYDEMARKGGDYNPKGVHGYNNTEVLMRAIFLGTGPYFKERATSDTPYKVKPFRNVEVYNILCEMLEIDPAQNNGTANVISETNFLPGDWVDPYGYPSVNFDIGGVLKEDSSYDAMFRSKQDRVTSTLEQAKIGSSENEEMTNVVSVAEKTKETETSTSKPAETSIVASDPDHAEDKEDDHNPSKGVWGSLGDAWDELQDDLEDFGEDLKEGAEDLIDEIEDAIDDLKGDNDDQR